MTLPASAGWVQRLTWPPVPLPTQGTSTKYSPQRVGLTHTMEHEDVIQIVKK